MKKYDSVICVNDKKTERYGFLWLNTRTVKVAGITDGKEYPVVKSYAVHYPTSSFYYLLIIDDNKSLQVHEERRFVDSFYSKNFKLKKPNSDQS